MRAVSFIILFLFSILTSSASADGVSALYNNKVHEIGDSLITDTLKNISLLSDTLVSDTSKIDTVKKHRLPWYIRFYRFADRVLSPPRDSNYIDVQMYNWCGEIQVTARFELYQMNAENFSLRMSPDLRWRVGPFFGWRFAFLGYNFDIKSLFVSGGETDLSASIYSAAFGLDLFYRHVGGNFNIRSLKISDIDFTDRLFGQPFDGINLGMTRISFYYVKNYKHYSHQAAFNQTNRQIKSAGSPIFGIQYAHNTLSVDVEKMVILLGKEQFGETSLNDVLRSQKNDEISLTGGYGYNWVFAKNWLAAGELTGSFGYLIQHNDLNSVSEQIEDEEKSTGEKIKEFFRKNIALSGTFRFSLLWNNGPWFAGTQVIGFYYQYGNGTTMSRNLLGSVYFLVGCNFGLPKALRKHKKK